MQLRDGVTIYVVGFRPVGTEKAPVIIAWIPYGKGQRTSPSVMGDFKPLRWSRAASPLRQRATARVRFSAGCQCLQLAHRRFGRRCLNPNACSPHRCQIPLLAHSRPSLASRSFLPGQTYGSCLLSRGADAASPEALNIPPEICCASHRRPLAAAGRALIFALIDGQTRAPDAALDASAVRCGGSG